ncbi:tetraacyldisaccharide 4'-kinase [Hyphococcus lacteus]|uniref:Tetraacyldisaccharide 4'-kinase n=1 Tax=Hyphococcus lacteus TaxID=3143536 RepID=A0ABV3Z5D3_9PROT
MMREPWFWQSPSMTAKAITTALRPAAFAYQYAHKLRCAMTASHHASVPVICIGNATLGGVGKTPLALRIHEFLLEDGIKSCFLTRGFGGSFTGPTLVDRDHHDADQVGDEALLLAARGNTIISRFRPAGAALAVEHGAQAILMDDGYQNPTLHKDISILLVDKKSTSDNPLTFPAGPFRETLASAKKRADLVIAVGDTQAEAQSITGTDFHAWLEPVGRVSPQKVIAFAGIGRPKKFFDLLSRQGFDVEKAIGFPDHHQFSQAELDVLLRDATKENAQLMTTEKDFVRLPEDFKKHVMPLRVAMHINDADGLKQQVLAKLKKIENIHAASSS